MVYGGRRGDPRDPYAGAGYPPGADDMTNFDPECAICSAPPQAKCGCESIALDKAIRMAEERMMANHFIKVRDWVRLHAQDYILKYYEALSERKKDDHARHLIHLQEQAVQYYGYAMVLPPQEVMKVNERLRLGLDECWKQSVNRYPEVLEYYYSLVQFELPSDKDPNVSDPSLSALAGASRRRAEPSVWEYREPPMGRRGDRGGTPQPGSRPRPAPGRSSYSGGGAYGGYDDPKFRFDR